MKKYLPIIGVIFAFNAACCLIISFSTAFASDSTNNAIQTLFFAAGCIGLPLLAFSGLAWVLLNIRRSRQAPAKLAQAMNLRLLHPGAPPMAAWYAGSHDGYAFAIKPVVTLSSTSGGSGRSYAAQHWLRIVVGLHSPLPGMAVERGSKAYSRADSFEAAFARRDGDLGLTPAAKQAMLTFVRLGFPTGVQATTYRRSPGTRGLSLFDRDHCPPELVAPEVLAEAPAVLAHDYADAASVTPERLRSILQDLIIVAHVIEE